MNSCPLKINADTLEIFNLLLILVPAAFYIGGMAEGKKGRLFFYAGLVLHVMSITARAVILGRLPMAEKFDNISLMALSMALVYLYFDRKKTGVNLSISAVPLVSVFILLALFFQPINTISPFLKSPWFYLHILLLSISYGFFGISASLGVHYLIERSAELETAQYRSAVHGWIMLSLALVAGSVWFYFAYGSYWLWTSKELWIMLMWFYYGLYLHMRLIKGLRGLPASVAGVLGFAVALFTYFGIGTVIPSPPTQF